MFYYSDPDTYTKTELRSRLMPGPGRSGQASGYRLDKPLRIQLISYQPDSPEHYYTMTSLEPDLTVYMTMEKHEAGAILSSALHHHDFYELMFLLEGNVYQKIENQRHLYTAGSCCLLNRNVRHSEEYLEEYGPFRLLFLQISEKYLKLIHDVFSMQLFQFEQKEELTDLEQFLRLNLSDGFSGEKDYVDFIPKKDMTWITANTHRLFDELTGELLAPAAGASFRMASLIVQLLQLLVSKENYTTAPVRIGSAKENELFEEIETYMELSHGRISRNELSQILHYSGSHMNRIVQKITGLSISEYGTSICMKEVARLLRTTDMPIQEIAQEMQFSNRTHFYQKFGEIYHMTPAQYRKGAKK